MKSVSSKFLFLVIFFAATTLAVDPNDFSNTLTDLLNLNRINKIELQQELDELYASFKSPFNPLVSVPSSSLTQEGTAAAADSDGFAKRLLDFLSLNKININELKIGADALYASAKSRFCPPGSVAPTRSAQEEIATPLAPAVTAVEASEQEFKDELFVSGTLVPREEAVVGVQIDGLKITEVLAEDGDWVTKDQVIARLDRSQLDALAAESDAALARAAAGIEQARNQIAQFEASDDQMSADLARAEKLQAGILSQATIDQRTAAARSATAQVAGAKSGLAIAEADKQSQEAQRRELEVRIARTDVRAPVAGIISRRTARIGALANSASDPLFRIISDGAIDLDAEVPVDDLARLQPALPAIVALPGKNRTIEGHIRLISAEVDKASRLGRVRIALDQGSAAIARVGSFTSAIVDIDHHVSIGIPASAVSSRAGKNIVELINDGRVTIRQVELGLVNGKEVEVTGGIAVGETIVARAAAFLREGDAVTPMKGFREARQ